MAPEVITNSTYDRKVDVYSFGILMFEIVTDLFPYQDLLNGKLTDFYFRNKVVNDNYRPEFLVPVKDSLKELIQKCWSACPKERPSFTNIFKKLSTFDSDDKNEYLLDDVDTDEFKFYLEEINVVNDPINHSIYSAPEILEEKKPNFKADVYSFALIAYLLITGKNPFNDLPFYVQIANILKGNRPDLSIIENKQIKAFLTKCWSKDPNDRPMLDEIIVFLCDIDFFITFQYKIKLVYKYISIFPQEQKDLVRNIMHKSLKKYAKSANKDLEFTIIILGSCCCGKTSLVNTYLNKSNSLDAKYHFGPFFRNMKVQTEYGQIKLSVYDFPGCETQHRLIPMCLNPSKAVVFLTNVNEPNDYKNLDVFVKIVSETTKCDLGWNSNIKDIKLYANKNDMTFFKTSIDDWKSLDLMFSKVASDLAECYFNELLSGEIKEVKDGVIDQENQSKDNYTVF